MKVEVTEPTVCKRVLDVEVPNEDIQKEYEAKVSHYAKNIKVPGFRPGKAPREMIMSRHSKAIMAETVEEMISKSFEKACKEKSIVPVNQAKIEELSHEEGKPIKYKAEVEVDPEIALKEYTGLGVKKEKVEIKDDDVEKVLKDLQERMASYNKVDRKSKKGDYLKYDYEKVIVNGQERSDYNSPQYPVPIGEAKIKEFDKALVGVQAGESVNVKFSFPKDYEVESVRGESADFTVKVKEVLEKKLPEVDDGFAKNVGQFESVDKMKEKIREDLLNTRTNESKHKLENEVMDKIIEKNEVPVPDSRVESYAGHMVEDMKKYYKGMKADEEMMENYRKIGRKEIQKYKILEWVAKKENVKATSEDADERIKKMAEASGRKFEELKDEMRKNGQTISLRASIKEEKAMAWLVEQNTK